MAPVLHQHRDAIEALCRRQGVLRLEVFGSAADPARFDAAGPGSSDVDFLYVLDESLPGLADRYFGLLEGLESILNRPVDLVSLRHQRNPYFVEDVNARREPLYVAAAA